MKSILSVTTTFSIAFLSGCSLWKEPVRVQTEPIFCEVAEVRRFSQIEIDWRAANAPTNLRKDLAQNEFGRENCPEEWLSLTVTSGLVGVVGS